MSLLCRKYEPASINVFVNRLVKIVDFGRVMVCLDSTDGDSVQPDLADLGPSRPAPQFETPLRVGIAPTPDFTLMSLSCFVEFLRLSADERDYSRQIYCAWDLLSHDDQPIASSCGFPMLPTRRFGDPRDYDSVVVHGGLP